MSDAPQEVALRVEGVSKTFRLPHEKHTSLKSAFLDRIRQSKSYEMQQALHDISFEVKKGEFFGIVGRNGGGKSTLLKCIAGVYSPNKGNIHVKGKLVPFIELGVGFNPELSGRDNVFLNGALLGFSRKQMEAMYNDIVEFAELDQFMDQKLKNYSSGMQVRLAFSIAIRAKGDILLLDEVLAVGDAGFQKKCNDYFYQLKEEGRTVVLVTHNMGAVEQYCDRALMIDSGRIQTIGSPSEIAQIYSNTNVLESANHHAKPERVQASDSQKINVVVKVAGAQKNGMTQLSADNQNLKLTIGMTPGVDIKRAVMGIVIYNQRNIPVFATNTRVHDSFLDMAADAERVISITIDNIFTNDLYKVAITVKNESGDTIYFTNQTAALFVSYGRRHDYAVVSPSYVIDGLNLHTKREK